MTNPAPVAPIVHQQTVSDQPTTLATSEPSEVLIEQYSPAPTKDGFFYGNQLNDTFKIGSSFYLITLVSRHATTAKFSLIQDDDVIRQAAGMPGSYLTPACQLRGVGSLRQARQVNVKPGQLLKQGDNWKITEKAIVTWE